jgi:hypothetical protein
VGEAISIRWAGMRRVLIFDPGAARLLEERFRSASLPGAITQERAAVVRDRPKGVSP